MDSASMVPAPGDLRVSDADRDRAITALSEHFQAGRLTHEEFDERSGLALQAKTERELTGLFTDLPTARALTAPTGDAVAVPGSRRPVTVARVIAVAAGLLAFVVVGSMLARTGLAQHLGGPHRGFAFPVPLLVVLFIVIRIAASRRRG
jgi:uncharacterized protein DUF1707